VVVLVLAVAGVWVFHPAAAENQPSIKAIMKKANDGDASLFGQVGKELMADEPNWAGIRTKTKELLSLADSLSKNTPPRGTKESWKKLTQEYATNLRALDDAAQKKNKDGADAAHQKLITSCNACHRVHKGK
jgi:cytochrome c556